MLVGTLKAAHEAASSASRSCGKRPGGDDAHSGVAAQRQEVPPVARDQVGSPTLNCGRDDRVVFGIERHRILQVRKVSDRLGDQRQALAEQGDLPAVVAIALLKLL